MTLEPLRNKDKMSKKWIFGGVAVVGLGAYLWSLANRIQNNIKYRFSNIKVKLGAPTKITMDLLIINNNNIAVEVLGFEGKLHYGDEILGDIEMGPMDLPAMSRDTAEIEVELKLIDVASTVLVAIQNYYLDKIYVKGKIEIRHPKTGVTIFVPYKERVI